MPGSHHAGIHFRETNLRIELHHCVTMLKQCLPDEGQRIH